ncbi:DNA helicase RecQ [Blautia marasmi]|uniref:DNA helicase RecQ n=1 Tax=Blautia marasmi TaxID=1917868 RepID=UPI000CF21BA2|nr:DNA helicase RecQ [Blautia marasmi]
MDKYQILKKYFGYDTFRDGQELLIDSILSGRDVLGIMPTGAGKSLCYQVPAMLMDGITLVISPLISLMKDQVGSLNQAGIHAAFLNSSLTVGQYYKALDYARQGRYPIIYVAPERLVTEEFLDFALHADIAMVAVDEAHCVSQWGQDFRPSYLKIVEFIKKLPKRPVVSAFTATATKEVRDDIMDILLLEDPEVLTTGFDRPNLYFGVQSPKNKYEVLKNYLEMHPGECGIVYCLTRKGVEEVCGKLREDGFSVTRYHAGLGDGERKRNQDDFIYDRYQIIVATNAFGMGIDKSNVRFVVHYNMPKNMESYYQEAGRAGRDGEPAECILLYGGQDVVTNQLFIDNSQDNRELDQVTREMVAERDRERLRKMTYYCFTNECLRDYILRYFGEYGENYCGNCSNCLSQFETVDVTETAKALIGCVKSSRQRYGTTVIIDTVHGANTAKIRNYRMDENPNYGELAKVPTYRLRQVINYLLLNEYLTVTNDEYAVVKLTAKSEEVLADGAQITMKMAKEQEHTSSEKKEKKSRKGPAAGFAGAEFTEEDEKLFEVLRGLRTEIAREEKVPPYIVFSDKTLTHMCILKPRTRNAMLSVTGVGEFKYEKYGERFVACIRDNVPDDGDSDDMSGEESADAGGNSTGEEAEENEVIRVNAEKKKTKAKGKQEFSLTEDMEQRFLFADKMTLSELVSQLNELRDESAVKRLTNKAVLQKLLDEGYLETYGMRGIPMQRAAEKGKKIGITAEMRVSEKGNAYEVLYYSGDAQRALLEMIKEG